MFQQELSLTQHGFPDGLRFHPRSISVGVCFGEFRSEIENQSGIINPEQEHQYRSGCAIRRCDRGFSDIKPSPIFPTLKSSEVTTAPTQTSRHSTLVLGRNLYIAAKRTAIIPLESTKSIPCRMVSGAGKKPVKNLPTLANAALSTKETVIKKPMPRSMPRKRAFFFMSSFTLPGSCVRQIVLRALFSSESTPLAPAIRVTMPIIVAIMPLEGRLAAPLSMSWIAAALFGPTSPPISSMILP